MTNEKKKILVIGAAGKIGRLFCQKAQRSGMSIKAMVRSSEQADEFEGIGFETVVADLEKSSDAELNEALARVDKIVFTAGSGGQTGGDKTLLVDLWGAIRTIRRAAQIGIEHYLMVSALRTENPLQGPEKIRHYLVAKNIADDELRRSGLQYTIVRPGRLTDDNGTGQVQTNIQKAKEPWLTSRENVADFLVHILKTNGVKGRTIDLVDGPIRIGDTFG